MGNSCSEAAASFPGRGLALQFGQDEGYFRPSLITALPAGGKEEVGWKNG
jgi:hypothetical protein